MDERKRLETQEKEPEVVDLRGGVESDGDGPEVVEVEDVRLTTQQLVRGVARAVGAVKYAGDEKARQAFETHYQALVGMVLEDWLAFDDCIPMLAAPQRIPTQVRLVVGVLVLVAGAAFIGPEGLRLPKRRPAGEVGPWTGESRNGNG